MSDFVWWCMGFSGGVTVTLALVSRRYWRDAQRLEEVERAYRLERQRLARLIAGAVEGPRH